MAEAKKAAPKAAKEKAAKTPTAKMYKLKKKIPETGLPPQAKAILEAIGEPGSEMARDKLMTKLANGALKGSGQEPAKIFSFYRKRLIDEGFIVESKVAA